MNFERTAIVFALIFLAGTAYGGTLTKRLAPGVTLTQEIDKSPPLIINVLKVRLDAPGVRVGVEIGTDAVNGTDGTGGREEVSVAARRHGALAAVNGDYFAGTGGDALGIGIANGALFSEPWWGDGKAGPRAAMGLTDEGQRVLFSTLGYLGVVQANDGSRARLGGINRRVGLGEIVAFTPQYGPTTGNRPGGTEVVLGNIGLPLRADKLMKGTVLSVTSNDPTPQAIEPNQVVLSGAPGAGADFLSQHAHPGEQIEFLLAVAPPDAVTQAVQIAELPRTTPGDLPSRSGENLSRPAWLWSNVQEAVGGGPRLLTDGQVTVDGLAEGFADWMISSRQPRTAVGATQDGHTLIIATVDGRQSLSQGVTIPDLALILKRYGAWNAINLDGGGSTAMAAGGLVVSSPPGDGSERRVAETLEVFSDRVILDGKPAPSRMQLAVPTSAPIPIGTTVPVRLLDGSHVISGSSPSLLWQGTASGIGFVSQRGDFTATTPGTGAIAAIYKGFLVTGKITVAGPAPILSHYVLSAQFAPNGQANYNQLSIRILDQTGKPSSGTLVHIAVTGGAADTPDEKTGPDGYAEVGVTWNAAVGGSVAVTSGGLTPVTLAQPIP
jgi:hypothetical protein